MTSLEKLIKHFERFPGIGSRQARRFAHHLLTEEDSSVKEISDLIAHIKETVSQCNQCFRFFSKNGGGEICSICSDTGRDHTKLMIVERDSDIQAIERSGTYDGIYFVLGGTVPLLDSDDTKKLRSGALKRRVEERGNDIEEIILGFAVNPDGENTARFVESILKDLIKKHTLKVSELGRGLSTGSELEYADPETIKNALRNRH